MRNSPRTKAGRRGAGGRGAGGRKEGNTFARSANDGTNYRMLETSPPRLNNLLRLGSFATSLLAIALFAAQSKAADFSHHTRLYMGSGYSFAKHSHGFYNPYYNRTGDTSRLFYTSHRGLGQLRVAWDSSWTIRRNNGLYINTASNLLGGGGGGSFIDQDFCSEGVTIDTGDGTWTCPQATTLWSETQHNTENWFLHADALGAVGFFLSRAKSRGRDFGLGLTFGYAYHNENDIATGGGPNIDLPEGITGDGNIIYRYTDQSLRIIGNRVFWRYPLIGIEIWSEQVPAKWRHPITMRIAANYIPFATFREEDSHFLRVYHPDNNPKGDLGAAPNIISSGEGEGFQVQGSFSLPIRTGRRKAPYPELVLALEWQKLFLKKGSTVFFDSEEVPSIAYPLTRFTTENISASLGVNLVW